MNSKISCMHIQVYNWLNFERQVMTILSINSIFFKLETQNLSIRSTIKTVLRISKNRLFEAFFIDKHFCEKFRACNYMA